MKSSENYMKKFYFVTSLIVLLLSTETRLLAATGPYIESIIGPSPVNVIEKNKNISAEEGDSLKDNDRVETGAQSSARIAYPDGSALILGRQSTLEIESPLNGAPASKLLSGMVQAVIEKSKTTGTQASGSHKFFISTPSGVVGVRGTQFIVEFSEAKNVTEMHALSGVVDMARDPKELESGNGVSIHESEVISAGKDDMSHPTPFDQKEFLASLSKTEPEVLAIREHPPRSRRKLLRARRAAEHNSHKTLKK
jgi:hypothetical protein